MFNKKLNTCGKASAVVILITLVLVAAFSWICTCGIIKLITLCFGLTFDWLISTGIWLIVCLVRSVFNRTITVRK